MVQIIDRNHVSPTENVKRSFYGEEYDKGYYSSLLFR